jgi:hypothetical protein
MLNLCEVGPMSATGVFRELYQHIGAVSRYRHLFEPAYLQFMAHENTPGKTFLDPSQAVGL